MVKQQKTTRLVAQADKHSMRLRSSKRCCTLGSEDIIRLVFGYLNERDRLRFMAASKMFTHWLIERRLAAHYTLDRLVGVKQSNGYTCFETVDQRDLFVCYKTHYVCLFPDDKGLLHVYTSWTDVTRSGIELDSGVFNRYFSPWVSTFVYSKKHDDFCIKEDDKSDSLWNRLRRATHLGDPPKSSVLQSESCLVM